MNNVERLIAALNSDDVEIIIRKTSAAPVEVENPHALQDAILDILSDGPATGKEIRERIAKDRGVEPGPIANEVAWALVELQNSTRKRSSYIDNKGLIDKNGKTYRVKTAAI